jgi:hypothetical protein
VFESICQNKMCDIIDVLTCTLGNQVMNVIRCPGITLPHLREDIYIKSIIYDGPLATCLVGSLIAILERPNFINLNNITEYSQVFLTNLKFRIRQVINLTKIRVKYCIKYPQPYEEDLTFLFGKHLNEGHDNLKNNNNNVFLVNRQTYVSPELQDEAYRHLKENGWGEVVFEKNKKINKFFFLTQLLSLKDYIYSYIIFLCGPVLLCHVNSFHLKQDYDFHIPVI